MRSPEVSVAALCDVDQRHVNRTAETIVDQKGHTDAEANALLGREYRKGYELPKVEPA